MPNQTASTSEYKEYMSHKSSSQTTLAQYSVGEKEVSRFGKHTSTMGSLYKDKYINKESKYIQENLDLPEFEFSDGSASLTANFGDMWITGTATTTLKPTKEQPNTKSSSKSANNRLPLSAKGLFVP
jgi:hypothetical protein